MIGLKGERLHGSYEALKYGTLLDGLADLTGGITESISIRQDPTTCGRMLSKLLEMTSLITCTVQSSLQQIDRSSLLQRIILMKRALGRRNQAEILGCVPSLQALEMGKNSLRPYGRHYSNDLTSL
ncbi:hypothetical protein J6590_041037 [Homalodisca vitripennis]|nr:hypothetical protein J6590_041037 [Homalodisca vitripennis]